MRATLTSLTKKEWDEWKEKELQTVKDILSPKDIVLDDQQIHISGERYLMSGKKLVLQGQHQPSQKKVIIKYSNDKDLRLEILDERNRKKTLENINFGYRSIYFPVEFLFEDNNLYTILITEYIDQNSVFIKLPIEKQFFLGLKALEAFEGVHSVVYAHSKATANLSKPKNAKKYLQDFIEMYEDTKKRIPDNKIVLDTLEKAQIFLFAHESLIEKYCDFLTHDDFVPHNVRIQNNDVVVLDHSSLILGNKYESWARFLNFMILFGPELDNLLSNYVKQNRGEEEYLMLRLMRVHRITFLINFYAKAISKTEGGLHIITQNRLEMWTKNLNSILEDTPIPKELIDEHHRILEEHRSNEEKIRHKDITG